MQIYRTILLAGLLVAFSSLVTAQEPFAAGSRLTQSDAEVLVKDLASQEEALEQSCLHIAAIYHEMAAPAEADSPSLRALKHHYERLAENEEKSASAAKKMAVHYQQLATSIHSSPDASKTRNLFSDSAYRR